MELADVDGGRSPHASLDFVTVTCLTRMTFLAPTTCGDLTGHPIQGWGWGLVMLIFVCSSDGQGARDDDRPRKPPGTIC